MVRCCWPPRQVVARRGGRACQRWRRATRRCDRASARRLRRQAAAAVQIADNSSQRPAAAVADFADLYLFLALVLSLLWLWPVAVLTPVLERAWRPVAKMAKLPVIDGAG